VSVERTTQLIVLYQTEKMITKDKTEDIIYKSWKKFIEGDNNALGIVFINTRTSLFLTGYYYLKDESATHDIINDIFLKFLEMNYSDRKKNLAGVNEKLETFLKVLVKNKSLDRLKTEKNRKQIISGIIHLFNRSNNNHDTTEIDWIELLILLPEKQRTIFNFHLAGYDNQAIANELDLSYNTVKNTLSSSKKKLRYLWRKLM
jgi:RNA polymerase sigma factor (sigma-70 family)